MKQPLMRLKPVLDLHKPVVIRQYMVLLILLVCSLVLSLQFWEMYGDDTFIHLRFVHNMIRGYGATYNIGDPTYGATSPLWLIVLTLPALLGFPLPTASAIVSLLLTLTSVIVAYVFALSILRNRYYALVAAFVWAVNPTLVRWAASGMESTLAAALVMLALYVYATERKASRLRWTPVIVGLCILCRPECLLLWGLIGLDVLAQFTGRQRWKAVAVLVGGTALVLAPWYLYTQAVYGTVIPNTAVAKGLGRPPLEGAMRTLERTALHFGASFLPSLALGLASVAGLGKHFRLAADAGMIALLRRHGLNWAWLVILPAVYIATSAEIMDRYLLLIYPILVVYALWAARKLIEAWQLRRVTRAVMVAIFVGLTLLHSVLAIQLIQLPYWAARQKAGETYEEIGSWFARETLPGTVVAIHCIGYFGYYSERPILDLAGLMTPEVLAVRFSHHKFAYLAEMRPDYLIVAIGYTGPVVDPLRVIPEFYDDSVRRAGHLMFSRTVPIRGKRLVFNQQGLGLENETETISVYRMEWVGGLDGNQ